MNFFGMLGLFHLSLMVLKMYKMQLVGKDLLEFVKRKLFEGYFDEEIAILVKNMTLVDKS